MTEQNYLDPGQAQPVAATQIDTLLQRIAQLEARVAELQLQLAALLVELPSH
jgi:hypothetical protein